MNIKQYQICIRCIMDTTDPEIIFDNNGFCNHCSNAINHLSQPPYSLSALLKEKALDELIKKIKQSGKNKKYDCVIGLSGGVDSSYLALLVKQWDLRPIAVHLDNKWNSNIAEQNIFNICNILNLKLEKVVVNWNEFKDLQLAFLKSSTPDSEIPSDNGINAILWDTAKKYKLKYILAGTNKSSESILPKAWSQGHIDKTYIKSIHKIFGNTKRLSFHILSSWDIFINKNIIGINYISALDYINYNKEEAKKIITDKLNWKDYGRKHGESIYTRIVQEYILPTKFNYDKRKAHLSSLIIAGQITRNEALKKISEPLYNNINNIKQDIDILCEKLEISKKDFEDIMHLPSKSISDYPHDDTIICYKFFKFIKQFLKKMNIQEKFFDKTGNS